MMTMTMKTPQQQQQHQQQQHRFISPARQGSGETVDTSLIVSDDDDTSSHTTSTMQATDVIGLRSSLAEKDRRIDELNRVQADVEDAKRELRASISQGLDYNHGASTANTTRDLTSSSSWKQEREELQEQVKSLEEMLSQVKGALQIALADKQSLQERVSEQQTQILCLQKESQDQRLRDRQAKKAVASLEEQLQQQALELLQLQQENEMLRGGSGQQKSMVFVQQQSASSESAHQQQQQRLQRQQPHPEHDNDDDEHDVQVRNQIAAVKASLSQIQQGSHQAKATNDSLSQEMENCRRLQQQLANRSSHLVVKKKGLKANNLNGRESPPMPIGRQSPTPVQMQQRNTTAAMSSLSEQVAALVASVQEREQYMAEIAESFQSNNARLPFSLYQSEIQQWKEALARLQHVQTDDNISYQSMEVTLRQSNQLLQQANTKLQQLETALQQSQQESDQYSHKAQTLWKVVQRLEQDKQEEIHLLDIVMQHLIELEEEEGIV